jgi:excisionase family DNA binding protein
VFAELNKYIEQASLAELPALLGGLEQAKALAWSRLAQPVPAAGSVDESLLNVEETSKLLNIPVSYVYDLARTHKLPKVKIGKYLRFSRVEVLAWARQQGSDTAVDARLSTVYSPPSGRKDSQKATRRVRTYPTGTRQAAGSALEHGGEVGAG